MTQYKWTPVYALAMIFTLQAAAFAEEPKIGTATATKNKVEGVIGGQNQPISMGTSIYERNGPHREMPASRIWSFLTIPISVSGRYRRLS